MLVINPLPPQIDPDRLKLLASAEPATIGHFLHTGFMDPAIRGLAQDVRIAGTAVPIRVPGFDGTIVHYALGQVRPGDVLVMDRCGDMKHAALGGAVAYAARAAGVAGIIVDGVVTDLGELRQYGVPVWARGPSPVTTKRLGQAGEFCVTISCGGVAVRPGDAILAEQPRQALERVRGPEDAVDQIRIHFLPAALVEREQILVQGVEDLRRLGDELGQGFASGVHVGKTLRLTKASGTASAAS